MAKALLTKLLDEAVRVAGNRAVRAAEEQNYIASRKWSEISSDIQGILRRVVELMADG